MDISAKQVKELREKSGAPMMDCKQALVEAKGDMEQAVIHLRKPLEGCIDFGKSLRSLGRLTCIENDLDRLDVAKETLQGALVRVALQFPLSKNDARVDIGHGEIDKNRNRQGETEGDQQYFSGNAHLELFYPPHTF